MIQANFTVQCPHCNINVIEQNFPTHEASCAKILTEKRKNGFLNIKDSFLKLNKNYSNQDEVTCPQCDKKLKFEQLDDHEGECSNRLILCHMCLELYPKNLMEFHEECCPYKNNPLQQQQQVNKQPQIQQIVQPPKQQISHPLQPIEQKIDQKQKKGFRENFKQLFRKPKQQQEQQQQQQQQQQRQKKQIFKIESNPVPKCPDCQQMLELTEDPYNVITMFGQGDPDTINTFKCNICQQNKKGFEKVYHCAVDQYDLCENCSNQPQLLHQLPKIQQAPQNFKQKPQIVKVQPKKLPENKPSQPPPQSKKQVIIQQQQKIQLPKDQHFNFENNNNNKNNIKKMQAEINKILDQGGDISQFQLEDHDMTNVGGVKKDIREQLPEIKFDQNQQLQDEENKKCCICMNDFIHQEKILLLPCLHRFHSDCIGYWINKNPTCPLCHKDINKFF